ncbi:MAG: 2-hydroxyacyl-CoA dehydratase [Candidatus Lokiarchaeota archaeon]|nr:2-hydroxyacyl-CoA dehydratase [Candidatus Lokiarchaeota archaeon]
MSLFTDDIITFKSVLRLAYNFLAGREYLKKKKFKERKKLVAVALPFSDLVFAASAIPVFPIRMEKFKIHTYLSALGSASNLFGWNLTSKLLSFARQLDVLKILDNVLDDVIHTINDKYNELYELGIEHGVSNDFCYGITNLTGMFLSKGKNVDANINYSIRCSAWNKYSESLNYIIPNSKHIWVDIPPRNISNSLELLEENIKKAISDLEDLTGNLITDNSLKKQFRIGNQVKRIYKSIIRDSCIDDFYPCNPATFAEILVLLGFSFQDYNSNAQRYLENISQLSNEIKERKKKGIGMDVSNMPKILITPMFGGWEPKTHEILYKLGARTIYADWKIFKLLEEIHVSNSSDPIEDYAKFLMNITKEGIGYDQNSLTDNYMKSAKELNVDGIIFNQVYGCHSIANCYTLLKNKIRRKLEIPTTVINFNKIGENIEQTRTRLEAFMELFLYK